MKKVTRQTRTTYQVNGVTYERLEDVPAEFRTLLEDANNDGVPDVVESFGRASPNERAPRPVTSSDVPPRPPRGSGSESDLIDLLAPSGDSGASADSRSNAGNIDSVRSVKATVTRVITSGSDLTPEMRGLIAAKFLEGDERGAGDATISCLQCGDDLTGSTIGRKCPECGHPVSASLRALIQTQPTASRKLVEYVFGTRGVLVSILLAALSVLVLFAMLM